MAGCLRKLQETLLDEGGMVCDGVFGVQREVSRDVKGTVANFFVWVWITVIMGAFGQIVVKLR